MKYLLSLCIIIFITALLAESSPAFPTTATTASPTYSASQPQTTVATGRLELSGLCSGRVVNLDLLTSEAMKQATVKALRQVSARTRQSFDRCVIYTPTEKSYLDESKINYLDESIDEFNSDRPWEETTNTAFLLVGVGMKSEPVSAGEDCASKRPVIAGSHDDLPSVLPSNWLEHFQVRKTINLKAGQMLIGVPLDRSDGSLADGYFAALKRKIEYKHYCSDGWYGGRSHTHSHKSFFKDELIHFNGAGILITGLTTLPALDAFKEDAGKHCEADSKIVTTASHEVYTEMLKGELNLKSLEVPDNGYMANIFRNEFFQILKPAISLSLADESENVYSALFRNRTLIGFSNNQVYSCYNKGNLNPVETAVDIDLTYRDATPKPEFIRALEFKDNYILGNAPKAMNLALPEHVKVSISNSEFVTTEEDEVNTRGISIDGPNQSSEEWQAPLTVDMTGNLIEGYQAALSLTGYQKLVLKSNRLLGKRVSIERRSDLTLPVTLSGDRNNQFNTLGNDPCHQLEHTTIIGGFVFSDGTTSCPGGFVIPTTGLPPSELSDSDKRRNHFPGTPSSDSRRFSEKPTETSYESSFRESATHSVTTPDLSSRAEKPVTSGLSLRSKSDLESITASSHKNFNGTSPPTSPTPLKSTDKRSNSSKDKISEHINTRGNSTREHPDSSPASSLPTHSQSLVTQIQPTNNNSTPAGLEFSDDRKRLDSSGMHDWQTALITTGVVAIVGAGIVISYVRYKSRRSLQREPLIKMNAIAEDPLPE
ncbi:hypothetical protein [Endozoicomonas sp. ALC020]|uniref:hypothetical protein n=1 Tax=unclassified Endozoicomonas TaxID=2644528 RepID=UPI003BAE9EBF